MKLAIYPRKTGKKGITNQLRREGGIPAILYGRNRAGEPIHVKNEEVQTILRNMKSGLLPTTVFELHDGSKKFKAIIKEIQYHVATYAIEHIDFVLLADDVPVTVNVPIQLTGVADCAGVKQGGFLRQTVRTLKVDCLPKHIPQEFTLDVRELNIAQSKRLSDIALPAGVTPKAKMNEVAVVIGKKAG